MYPIHYYYPKGKDLSFTYIAERHIELLARHYAVNPLPLGAFPASANMIRQVAVLHPYFYPLTTLGEVKEAVLRRVRSNVPFLVGVDVADSDAISSWAAELANLTDAFIVNSFWSYDAYVKSGVKPPVYIVPHGLEAEWFREPRRPIHPVVRALYDIKQRRRPFTILYFLWHSGWRKGADLAAKLMECIERAKIDYMLVVKKMDITDPAFKLFTRHRMFVVEGRLARDWLIDIYDLADLVLLPSRGGSFELSGLEALGRGVPVLMPNVGPWVEYTPPGLERYLHVKTARMVEPLPGNQIHVGKGAEWDPEDACLKFVEIYTNYDEVKARAQAGVEWIRRNYSWDAVEEKIRFAFTKILGY